MSTSYNAVVLYGLTVEVAALTRPIPNPLWGKHKFDPETGERVTKMLEDGSREDAFRSRADKLDIEVVQIERGDDMHVGILLAKADAGYQESCMVGVPTAKDCDRLSKLLVEFGIPVPNTGFETTLVTYCW
jgi:hypothetical protein